MLVYIMHEERSGICVLVSPIIMLKPSDHGPIGLRPSGQAFEVLDWSSYTSQPSAYLRIGEPTIWR